MSSKVVDAILAVSAIVVAATVVSRSMAKPAPPAQQATAEYLADWRQYDDSSRRGNPSADGVVAILFSDYQCPFCAELDHSLDSIVRTDFEGRVEVLVRHFPLEQIHPFARTAAVAAECARREGRFPEYHRAVLTRQRQLGPHSFAEIARDVGIGDSTAFERCVRDPSVDSIVELDVAAGNRLGMRGTPYLILGDSIYPGALAPSMLSDRLRAALR